MSKTMIGSLSSLIDKINSNVALLNSVDDDRLKSTLKAQKLVLNEMNNEAAVVERVYSSEDKRTIAAQAIVNMAKLEAA
jgi:hypothetical protein